MSPAEDDDDGEPEGGIPEGLVAVGGTLDADTLIKAYRAGIFPWSSDPEITWWCPDPRAIFELSTFQPSRSLRKRIRQAGWHFEVDQDFEGVMRRCAEPTERRPSTWITDDFVAGYTELHRRGLAHSVEVYEGEGTRKEMVGGLYGVAIGGFFGGESMFHKRKDASKAALGHLIARLRAGGFVLLDAQVPNPHLLSLGAVEIPRGEYLRRLRTALARTAFF